MHKIGLLLLVLLAVLPVACTPDPAEAPGSAASPGVSRSGDPATTPAPPEATTPPEAAAPVFAPHELLSAEEATELVGYPILLEEGSLYRDEEMGTISERYVYDLGSSTIHALFEVRQDSLTPAEALAAGRTALESFQNEKERSKGEITLVDGVGDEAFLFTNTGNLHAVYGGYYLVVCFRNDPYDDAASGPLNVLLAQRILENLEERL